MRPYKAQDALIQLSLPIVGSIAAIAGLAAIGRRLVNHLNDKAFTTLLNDPYYENLWQMFIELKRVSAQNIMDTELRAGSSHVLLRPLGSPTTSSELHRIVFAHIAQLAQLPTPEDTPVSTAVTIGSNCIRPLHLEIPIIVGGIENMFLLNDRVRMAMAKGTTLVGAGFNPGSSPRLPAERKAARCLVRQFHRGTWMKLDDLSDADAVEIVLGEGSGGSNGICFEGNIEPSARKALHMPKGVPIAEAARFPDLDTPANLPKLVAKIRSVVTGVPVGIRLAGSQTIEADLVYAVDAGIDFIVISGGDTGSLRGLPILQDDFSMPVLWSLYRARRCLDQHDKYHSISLVVSGGLSTPGDFLKCLALGADAVCTCTVALFAAMSGQQERVLPGEPPTRMLLREERYAQRFRIEHGSENVANWLQSTVAEMTNAVRTLGKNAIADVDRSDLGALDKEVAEALGIPFVAVPQEALQGAVHSL